MAISFDGPSKVISLSAGVTDLSSQFLWSEWVRWLAVSDNAKYLPAFRSVGGDDLGAGLSIPLYYFLQNGWRIRPMEENHNLTITGNLFVEGGGVPVINTLGAYQVNVNYTVPIQAQGINIGGTNPTVAEIAAAIRADLAAELAQITKVSKIHGVGVDLVVTPTSRTAGDLQQTISTSGDATIVSAA